MQFMVYVIPIVISILLLFNGLIKYMGNWSKEDTKKIYPYFEATQLEEKHWEYTQKLFGKLMCICGDLNVATMFLLIPITMKLVRGYEAEQIAGFVLLFYTLFPSLLYMISPRVILQMKLKRLEDEKSHEDSEKI